MDREHELELVQRVQAIEDRSKSNTKRLDALEKSTDAIHDLAASVKVMVIKQDTMNANVEKLATDVETLKAEPGKRWKFVIEKAIYFVVAAVMGFILAKFGF